MTRKIGANGAERILTAGGSGQEGSGGRGKCWKTQVTENQKNLRLQALPLREAGEVSPDQGVEEGGVLSVFQCLRAGLDYASGGKIQKDKEEI